MTTIRTIAAATITAAALVAAAATSATAVDSVAAGRGGPGGPGKPAASAPANPSSPNQAQSGTLTTAQKAQLAYWVQEEKLAQDLYWALAEQYPNAKQFATIAKSETQHMTAVRNLMTTYGVADPTVGLPAGEFTDPTLQALYDDLLASATSQQAALAAGAQVERTDIADLTAAKQGVTATDVLRVLDAQIKASQNHLRAFTR
jgi:hypothetical protein